MTTPKRPARTAPTAAKTEAAHPAPEVEQENAPEVEQENAPEVEQENAPEVEQEAAVSACGANVADYNPFYRDILCELPAGHEGNHVAQGGQWPSVDGPAELCGECYPQGWPAQEHGAHAGCPHGSWIYGG